VSTRFRRGRGGVTVTVDPGEAGVIRGLVEQLLLLLADEAHGAPEVPVDDPLAEQLGIGAPAQAPEDPVLARLLPDAYRDDPQASAEFRRYTQRDLVTAKREAAEQVLADLARPGERLVLGDGPAHAWLGVLNDLRLALGTRLGVTDDEEGSQERYESLDDDDPQRPIWTVYLWLGWLQETLVRSLW
jgi:uncharacterized protein DUF2017